MKTKISKSLSKALAFVFSFALVVVAIGVAPVSATDSTNPQPNPPDIVSKWPGSVANKPAHWQNKLPGSGWKCEKVDREGMFVTDSNRREDAIITKGGLWNNVFFNVAPNTKFTYVVRPGQPNAGISHWFKCDQEKPEPKPPELKVQVACIAGKSGIRNTAMVKAVYQTHGKVYTLKQKITYILDSRSNKSWDTKTRYPGPYSVVDGGSKVTKQHVGRGNHVIKGWARLGSVKKYFNKTVRCAPPLIKKPRAYIDGPCKDPEYGFRYDNRLSNRNVTFETFVNGRKIKALTRTVSGGKMVRVGPIYVPPFAMLVVKDGAGNVLAKERAAAGGYYGVPKVCQPYY